MPLVIDEKFYKKYYSDLLKGMSPEEHYRTSGSKLALYTCEWSVERDAINVDASGRFDAAFYQDQVGRRDDPLFDYLLNAYREDLRPSNEFDVAFFRAYYRRSIPEGMSPFVFFCRHAARPWCFPRLESAAELSQILLTSGLFDAEWFSATYLDNDDSLDPMTYFCTEGFRLMMNPSERFNTRAYMMQYPDIAHAQMNPLFHYFSYGKKEGRTAFSKQSVRVKKSAQKTSNLGKTILVVCHEASRSGAPIVGLNLVKALRKKYNVVTLLMKGGPLEEQFVANSSATFYCDTSPGNIEICLQAIVESVNIDCAILNSIVTIPVLEGLAGRDVPCISLIHEFSQYLRPGEFISRAVALSDQVVVPAEVVKNAILDEMRAFGLSYRPNNIRIIPQGQSSSAERGGARMTEEDIFRSLGLDTSDRDDIQIVLGAGSVQPRKGVDLFIATARRVRDKNPDAKIKFVWVGGNFRPDSDYHYSVYLADQISRSGLTDMIVMIDEQPSLAQFWRLASVFFMSSRLDPYPNVALDALSNGIEVVCFEKATGIAELAAHAPAMVKVAPYCDVDVAADLVLGALADARSGRKDRSAGYDGKIAEMLDFSRYVTQIDGLIHDAARKCAQMVDLSNALLDDDQIDPAWMRESLPTWLVTDSVGLANNIVGLSRIAARLQLNAVPAVWPSRGLSIRAGEADARRALAPYVSESYRLEQPPSRPIAIVALVSTDEDVKDIAELASAGVEIEALHLLIDESNIDFVSEKFEGLAATVTAHAVRTTADIEQIASEALGRIEQPYAILLRSPSTLTKPEVVRGARMAAIDFANRLETSEALHRLVFIRADRSDVDNRGRWRASRRLGVGTSENNGGFPLGARISEDVLIVATGSSNETASMTGAFFHGGLYRRKETGWIDEAIEFTSKDGAKWAILEPVLSTEKRRYDALFGYAGENGGVAA